jgi:plasmid stabilization system protein ParE
MARIELAPELQDDFDRNFDHLAQCDLDNAAAQVRETVQAFDVLETNPLVGRPASGNERERIIGRRSRGFVALYRHAPEIDTVFILAVQSQREAGYRRG